MMRKESLETRSVQKARHLARTYWGNIPDKIFAGQFGLGILNIRESVVKEIRTQSVRIMPHYLEAVRTTSRDLLGQNQSDGTYAGAENVVRGLGDFIRGHDFVHTVVAQELAGKPVPHFLRELLQGESGQALAERLLLETLEERRVEEYQYNPLSDESSPDRFIQITRSVPDFE